MMVCQRMQTDGWEQAKTTFLKQRAEATKGG
jgi:hypothetical protein